MISGKAMVCGVIGNPMMHNYYGEALKLDYIYVPCNVDDDKVGEAIRGAYALGFEGINVTVPHKQRVMEHLLAIDDAARCIGAVNTLVRMEGGYKGYNTDADGLYRAIMGHGINPEGKDCLMIGAGGAAKAVAYMLILNRTMDKARTLAEEMNRQFGRETIKAMALEDYGKLEKEHYLAFQTTSVGMYPKVGHAPIEDTAFYKKIQTAVDIV